MSAQISQSVIKALHKLVGETPYYVTMVEAESDRKFLILGKTKVFFVDNSLKKTNNTSQDDFEYSKITQVEYYMKYPNFFKLKIRDDDNRKTTSEHQFICEDAKSLINSLKCYWQIDNMDRTLSFRELHISIKEDLQTAQERQEIQQQLIGTSSAIQRKMPSDVGYCYHQQKNYKFQLGNNFERNQKRNSEFIDTSSAHTGNQNSSDVQVFEMIPVDYLDKMSDEKADLKTYCQNAALSLIASPKTTYLLEDSRPYIKKYNFCQDKAQWSCWQVHLRVEDDDENFDYMDEDDNSDKEVQKNERDIFMTAVRRKYIPPLMECYQDILVYSVYNYEKSDEAEKARASKVFLKQVHQRVVDTLYPCTGSNLNIYHQFVTQKANALLMDESSMNFFEQQLNIRPDLAAEACEYVKSIVLIYKEPATGQKRKEYKGMIKLLDDQILLIQTYQNQRQNQQKRKEEEKRLEPKKYRLMMQNRDNSKQGGGTDLLKKVDKAGSKKSKKAAIWRKKVARYLAFCVDGGLLQKKFTLMTMIEGFAQISDDDKLIIQDELAELLHAHIRGETEIMNQLKEYAKDIDPQKYSFNQNVMVILIQEGYLAKIMQQQKTYPKFLTAMLRDDSGEDSSQANSGAAQNALAETKEIKADLMSRTLVKEACCRQIIKLFEQSDSANDKGGKGGDDGGARGKGNQNDDDKVEFVKLVEPLMQTMKSDNHELAALATSALVNLCNYSPDIKQIFFTKDGLNVILEYLNAKKEIILLNVLRLIQVFIANSANQEQFTKKIAEARNQEAVKSLLKILHGPGIGTKIFSQKVYFFVIIILRQIIRFYAQAKDVIIQSPSLKKIIDKIRPINVRQIPPNFEIKIYQFLIQLVKEDVEKKTVVGNLIFKEVFQERLNMMTSADDQEANVVALFDSGDEQTIEIEQNFFKLMHILAKNSVLNHNHVKEIKAKLVTYVENNAKSRPNVQAKINKIIADSTS